MMKQQAGSIVNIGSQSPRGIYRCLTRRQKAESSL